MAFPTLSRRHKSVKVSYEENVIKSKFESGYELRRKRFTKTRKKFNVTYDLIPTADRDLLLTHFDTVGQYVAFNWTDQYDVVHIVFYDKPLELRQVVPGWFSVDSLNLIER